MKTFFVTITQTVEVKLDETKFDASFMAQYVEHISHLDTVEEHAMNLAWVQASGREDMEGRANPFVEGYGPAKDMGISARVIHTAEELDDATNWAEAS